MTRLHAFVALLVVVIFSWVGFYIWPIFGLFTLGEALLLVVLASGVVLLGWLPVVYPLVKVFRTVPVVPWRFRFVLVVASSTYGIAFLILAVLGLPLEFYLVYLAPQLQALGERIGEPVVSAGEFLLSYWWIGAPVALSIASVALTRYLLPRWPRVVSALSG